MPAVLEEGVEKVSVFISVNLSLGGLFDPAQPAQNPLVLFLPW
jgi:hypothetical protein